jgi:hypothetical protein
MVSISARMTGVRDQIFRDQIFRDQIFRDQISGVRPRVSTTVYYHADA